MPGAIGFDGFPRVLDRAIWKRWPSGSRRFPPWPTLREDALPEVVKRPDLHRSLEVLFETNGNVPLTLAELVHVTFALLHPPFPRTVASASAPAAGDDAIDCAAAEDRHRPAVDSPFEHLDVERRLQPEALLSQEQEQAVWEVRAESLAQGFLWALAERTHRAAVLRYGTGLSLEEVARCLAVSRGTAENEVGDRNGKFGKALRALVVAEGLELESARELLALVIQKLRCVHRARESETEALP